MDFNGGLINIPHLKISSLESIILKISVLKDWKSLSIASFEPFNFQESSYTSLFLIIPTKLDLPALLIG